MTVSRRELLAGAIAAPWLAPGAARSASAEAGISGASFVDDEGVWRWRDGSEVALFGVNYNLQSASAFRFAKASGMSFTDIIERDFAHFRRLGFNALRLCLWGDWENSARDGTLIDNEHLAVLDMVVARAQPAGLSLLLSPIVTYDAAWPDALDRPRGGLSSAWKKEALGTDPAAIAAQACYLGQLLARINTRTGRAYAAEPAIVALEPINEPAHHPEDLAQSRAYIAALAGAVRAARFPGPIFYNATQDMRIAPAIAGAPVQGATFAWYPTGLQNGRAVEGNALLLVDDYAQMRDPALARRAKLVYEFDAADTMASYLYPAMARAFRDGGAQFATMFAYDPFPIAAANSEFNDHFLNLAFTPAKAISALIAGCAMRELPRGGDHGRFPANMRFGAMRVDDRGDLSELVDARRFFHSNDTATRPPVPMSLEHLAGCGSSPVVRYDGTGAWFLDRDGPGEWRLEVYPDAALVANPFEFRRPSRAAVRIVHRARAMRIQLPDLGPSFAVIDAAGGRATARDGAFAARPGVYRLSRAGPPSQFKTPFFAPPADSFAAILLHEPPRSLTAAADWRVAIEIVAPAPPDAVSLCLRLPDALHRLEMRAGAGFRYEATVPGAMLEPGYLDYYIAAESSDGARLWPSESGAWPGQWDFPKGGGFRVAIMPRNAPLTLFDAAHDGKRIIVPYGGYAPFQGITIAPDPVDGEATVRLDGAAAAALAERDLPMQLGWNGALDPQGRELDRLSALLVEGRSLVSTPGAAGVILIERDGMAWGARIALDASGTPQRIPLASLRPAKAALLPRDFPKGINPYWMRLPMGRGGPNDAIRVVDLQAIQITLGERFLTAGDDRTPRVAISRILLER